MIVLYLMDEKRKNLFFYSVVFFIIILGIFLRVLFFSFSRPFWNDESALVLNIINRGYSGLFSSLDYFQAAPPLFCVICKFFFVFIKKIEFAMRFPALICSVLSLPVFFIFSRKLLKTKLAAIFALLLFSLNYQLIYYSQEVKQYSCDVFFFLSVLLLYFYINLEKIDLKNLLLIGLFLAVIPWISYTALFAEVILFLLLIFKNWKKTILLFILPLISSLCLLPLMLKLDNSSFMQAFWAIGFLDKDFSNISELLKNNAIFYFMDFPNKFFIALMLVAGLCIFAINYKSKQSKIIFLPLILAILLSYLHIYPMYLRTGLYLFPIILILTAKPFDVIKLKFEIINYIMIGFLFAHFTLCTFKTDYIQIIKKQYYKEDTTVFLNKFIKISKPDDTLVVPASSRINFDMYKNSVKLQNRKIIFINNFIYDIDDIKKTYSMLPENNTYYILLTHSSDKPYEYKNLCDYAKAHKNAEVLKDKDYNALIRFSK